MVLMRRKDKRRENGDDEIIVASDSSIVANKGVRSLQGARTGRFAADMRVHVGGYGRADKTWGVDHPWHQTREDLYKDLSARDRLEEGILAKQEEKKTGQGLSRAALKKKRAKMKKGGATATSSAGSELGAGDATRGEGDAKGPESATPVATTTPTTAEVKPQKKEKVTPSKEVVEVSNEATSETAAEENAEQPLEAAPTTPGASKKRKRVNRNKKKQERARLDNAAGDISDEDVEDEPAPKKPTKADKKKSKKTDDEPSTTAVTQTEEDPQVQKKATTQAREALAAQYESAMGQEFTTASGLVVRDLRIGQGRLPEVGEMLTVRYRGRLGDKNGLVFGKGMLSINYGTGSVIAGWEEGLSTMRPGGSRLLTIPPELGYGAGGKGGKIPPNSTLYFEVELVRIGKRKRDAVGTDEIPLPSSFQRKRIKQQPAATKGGNGDKGGNNGKGKRRRRKHSI